MEKLAFYWWTVVDLEVEFVVDSVVDLAVDSAVCAFGPQKAVMHLP